MAAESAGSSPSQRPAPNPPAPAVLCALCVQVSLARYAELEEALALAEQSVDGLMDDGVVSRPPFLLPLNMLGGRDALGSSSAAVFVPFGACCAVHFPHSSAPTHSHLLPPTPTPTRPPSRHGTWRRAWPTWRQSWRSPPSWPPPSSSSCTRPRR